MNSEASNSYRTEYVIHLNEEPNKPLTLENKETICELLHLSQQEAKQFPTASGERAERFLNNLGHRQSYRVVNDKNKTANLPHNNGKSSQRTISRNGIVIEEVKIPHHSHHHHRQLFKKPVLQKDELFSTERKATWSELFFDVFFVPIWITLAHREEIMDLEQLIAIAVGFAVVWFSWKHTIIYATRYDTDDVFHRLMLLLQLCALAGFAISIQHIFTERTLLFNSSFLLFRVTLLIQYVVVYIFHKEGKGFLKITIACHVLSIVLILGTMLTKSILMKAVFWIGGLDPEFCILLTKFQKKLPFSHHHLPERIGLMSMLIIGEIVNNSLVQLKNAYLDAKGWEIILLLISSVFSTFCVWWLYFDDFNNMNICHNKITSYIWIYSHLFLHFCFLLVAISLAELCRLGLSTDIMITENPHLEKRGIAITGHLKVMEDDKSVVISHFFLTLGTLLLCFASLKWIHFYLSSQIKVIRHVLDYGSRFLFSALFFGLGFYFRYHVPPFSAFTIIVIVAFLFLIQVIINLIIYWKARKGEQTLLEEHLELH